MKGGFGNLAHGHHKYGAADTDDFQTPSQVIEPRFNVSKPLNGAHNVPLLQWITFEIYYYTDSFYEDSLNPSTEIPFEISEDAGVTWVDASLAPYTLTTAFKEGHILWIKIVKAGLWTDNSEIIIQTLLYDEFGHKAAFKFPVKWSD